MSAEARPAGVPNNRAARTVYVMRSTGAGSEPGGGGSSGSPLNTDSGTHSASTHAEGAAGKVPQPQIAHSLHGCMSYRVP